MWIHISQHGGEWGMFVAMMLHHMVFWQPFGQARVCILHLTQACSRDAMLHLVLLDQPLETFSVQHDPGGDQPCSLMLLPLAAPVVIVPSEVVEHSALDRGGREADAKQPGDSDEATVAGSEVSPACVPKKRCHRQFDYR